MDRYLFRRVTATGIETLSFDGDALRPAAGPSGNSVLFELVQNGHSQFYEFDLTTHKLSVVATAVQPSPTDTALSPDTTKLAFVSGDKLGNHQVWVRDLQSGKSRQVTQGFCNSDSPTWDPGSQFIVFASDCNRGYGLPALYRARIE